MEPKSDSVIITIADSNKGPGPSPSPTDIIDHTSIKEAAHDHQSDLHHHHHQSDHHHHDHQSDHHHHDVGPTSAAAPAPKKKRSGGAMHILQLAFFMLRRRHRSDGKSKPTSFEGQAQAVASTKGTWKRLVGSIRPLHLQTTSTWPPSSVHTPAPSERYEDVLPPPMSPARTDDLSSEDGMTSRYTSAVNLQELDRTDEDNDNAAIVNANIDAKAEEFIAQFYQQMRLQRLDRLDSVHLSCNDTIRRSTS